MIRVKIYNQGLLIPFELLPIFFFLFLFLTPALLDSSTLYILSTLALFSAEWSSATKLFPVLPAAFLDLALLDDWI